MNAIETDGLAKRYPVGRHLLRRGAVAEPIRALEDLTIEVRTGEIFGFLGPNGSGKSTLIRVLLGFLHPSAGSATVLGLDSVRDSVAIRARTGYLPGGIALYDSLRGRELLDYLGSYYRRPPALRAELLDRLELSEPDLDRPIRDYSRGMRQKLGIVQALQHDPEMAILDEPSEGLDPLMQRAFYGILEGRRAAGRTIFFSSHVLSEVERVCDRVAIVRHGRLVALEDVDALLAHRRRAVEIRLGGDAPGLAEALATLPGASDVVVRDSRISLGLEGDVTGLLAALHGLPVADLTIEPARLEEAFLELYADGPA